MFAFKIHTYYKCAEIEDISYIICGRKLFAHIKIGGDTHVFQVREGDKKKLEALMEHSG